MTHFLRLSLLSGLFILALAGSAWVCPAWLAALGLDLESLPDLEKQLREKVADA